MHAGQIIGTMNGHQVVALGIAKQVFQMHTVNMGTGDCYTPPMRRLCGNPQKDICSIPR